MERKKVVMALGGNALGNTLDEQFKAVKNTAKVIVDLIEKNCEVIITHGNGPQVGMINNAMSALAENDPSQKNTPLSVCVAMSQAYIGYDLQNAIREELLNRNIDKSVTTVVTQVRVNEEDPAFSDYTKPIGKFYTKEQALEIHKQCGYTMKEDAGRGWRRYVASPMPVEIIEIDAIKSLIKEKTTVIACGGGGIPVVKKGNHLHGASAVIDKDFASELLAEELDADYFIILTAVEKVAINYNKENQQWLSSLTYEKAQKYINEEQFAKGSMLPKVEAAMKFAKSRKGRISIITQLEKAKQGIEGKTGTRFEEN